MGERGLSRQRWRRPDHAARGERVRSRRVFFALWPGAQFRQDLGAIATRSLARVEGRRLGPDDWHVTVCFIGAVNEALLAPLQASTAALVCTPFTLRFDRIQYWPEARVVAATAGEVPELAVQLSSALRDMTRSLGLTPDEKPLRPHVTLMRGVNPLAWQMNLDSASASLSPGLVFEPEALYLAESRPQAPRGGPMSAAEVAVKAPSYLRLASWPLQR